MELGARSLEPHARCLTPLAPCSLPFTPGYILNISCTFGVSFYEEKNDYEDSGKDAGRTP
jgi:hypothetical protein